MHFLVLQMLLTPHPFVIALNDDLYAERPAFACDGLRFPECRGSSAPIPKQAFCLTQEGMPRPPRPPQA
jgi:hypothetical protein